MHAYVYTNFGQPVSVFICVAEKVKGGRGEMVRETTAHLISNAFFMGLALR